MTTPPGPPVGPGPVALVGSGEYLEVMAGVEGALLAGRPPRFVQLPTAAAPEGPASLDRWVRLGREQAERLGVTAVPVVVRDRAEADDPELARLVAGAGLVYLSGGSPPYCAATLRGTRVWAAVLDAWRAGAALAGCSAGAMSLTSWVPDLRHPARPADPGLGVVPEVRVVPHFDRFVGWLPDLLTRYLARVPPGTAVVGVDEDTAVVWRDGAWTVHGRQSAWLLTRDGRTPYAAGQTVPLPPPGGSTARRAGPAAPGHPVGVVLFLPLLLIGPVMMLIVAVQSLAAHGPLGWLAAAGLLVGVYAAVRWSVRAVRVWWAGTRAPVREPEPARARPVPPGPPSARRR